MDLVEVNAVMGNKTEEYAERSFEILCNIVDAYYLKDKKMMYRKVMEAVKYMESIPSMKMATNLKNDMEDLKND